MTSMRNKSELLQSPSRLRTKTEPPVPQTWPAYEMKGNVLGLICLRASLEGWLTALSCLLALTVPFTANVHTSCSKPTHPRHPLTHPKPLSPHSLLQTHLPQALTPSTHPPIQTHPPQALTHPPIQTHPPQALITSTHPNPPSSSPHPIHTS